MVPPPSDAPGAASYRHQEIRPLCICCNEEASAFCPRCDAPHCADHKPSATLRCGQCEAFYNTTDTHRKANPLTKWMLALTYLGMAGVTAIVTHLAVEYRWFDHRDFVPFFLSLVCTLALTPLLIVHLRHARLRKLFLDEAPQQRRLAIPKVDLKPPQKVPKHVALATVSLALLLLGIMPLLGLLGSLIGIAPAIYSLYLSRRLSIPTNRKAYVAIMLHTLIFVGQIVLFWPVFTNG